MQSRIGWKQGFSSVFGLEVYSYTGEQKMTINPEETRILAVLFVFQALQWIAEAWRHYFGASPHEDASVSAPRYLRLLFGDFRAIGTLNLRAAILQTIVCLAMSITLATAWHSELTRDWVMWLIFIQLNLEALVVILGRLLRL